VKKHEQELNRMDRKKKEMRNKIINTTVRLIESNGFEATTMEQIAREADIAKGTLYNYYSEKGAIISDYIRQTFETKNTIRLSHIRTLMDTHARMVYMINNLMDGVKLKKEIFEKYLVYSMMQVLSFDSNEVEESGIAELILTIIELGQQNRDIRCDLPLTMITDFFQFIFIEVAKQYYMNPESFKQNEVVEKSVDLFINGVKPVMIQGGK